MARAGGSLPGEAEHPMMPAVSTLAEIEAAAEALGPEEKEKLFRSLALHRRRSEVPRGRARLVRQDGDVLLEAPPDAPLMTPERVKQMLDDWP